MLQPYDPARPNTFSPFGWYMLTNGVTGASGTGSQPRALYDPTNYFNLPKGQNVILPGDSDVTYNATDDEIAATFSVAFTTETVPSDKTLTPDRPNGGTGQTYNAMGLYVPRGSAASLDDAPFFPVPDSFLAQHRAGFTGSLWSVSYFGTDLGQPIGGAVIPRSTYHASPDTFVIYPDTQADGSYYGGNLDGPPYLVPYDVYAPGGEYLVGKVHCLDGTPYRSAARGYFHLFALSLYPASYAGPGGTDVQTFPLVPFAGYRDDGSGIGPGAPASPASIGPALLGRPSFHYNRAACSLNTAETDTLGVSFWLSVRAVPTRLNGTPVLSEAWDFGPVPISAIPGDKQPALAEDSRGLLYCLFTRPDFGICITRSDSDGQTWNPSVLLIPHGSRPAIVSQDGDTLAAAIVKVGTAPNTVQHLQGVRRGPGDSAFGAPFTFTDGTTALSVADDGFGLAYVQDGPERTLLHVSGAGGTALWETTKPEAGWTLAVPALILGGAHPALISHDGETLAAAVVTTGSGTSASRRIAGRLQGPGDAAFRPVQTFKDATGAALLVADSGFGLGRAAEGADRFTLHVLLAGESATSDWWSADGATWTRALT